MIRALLYLRLMSLKNQLVSRARRLQQPKYLLGALGTAAYFYYFIFRRWGASAGGLRSPPLDPILIGSSIGILLVVIGWVTFAWILPSDKGGLRFSPAEISFLFPAPVSRRMLVHFSLLSAQLKIILSAALLGLIWNRRGFSWEGAVIRTIGWWIILSAAELHRTGANLTFMQRKERGHDLARSRALAIGIVILFLAAVAGALWRDAPRGPRLEQMATGQAWAGYLATLLNTGALRWLLLPFRMIAGPFLATGGHAFIAALGPALLLLAAHYWWIMRLEVSFAEGSISFAEKRAQAQAARLAGGSPFGASTPRARRAPFRLAPRGRPEGAFLWKNLLSISTTINWRMLLIGGVILFQAIALGLALSASGGRRSGTHPLPIMIVGMAGLLAFYTLLYGPQFARQDLRNDLPNADLLKTYPLAGWQIVLGEMLAPIALLSGVLWLLLLAAAWGLAAGNLGGLTPGVRLAATVCAACLAPPICALELLVPNAAMLLFPSWHQATRSRSGGVEAIGQRLIFVLGQFLAVVLLLLPAVLAVPILIFATQWLIGPAPAMMVATAAALAIIGGEVWCGVWWLGERFAKLDLSQELKP